MKETPHFQIGHMCAGCKISNYLHTGCVVSEDVRVIKTEQNLDIKNKSIENQLSVDVQIGIVSVLSS